MIKLTDKDKTLVVPAGLGNFGQSAGSGSGVTPEEAAQIASAVTAEALDEYDTELQVDLEEIRDAVSGNSEDISTLSATTEEISQQIGSLSGLTDDIAAISGQTSANTQNIGILSAVTSGLAVDIETLSAITSGMVSEQDVIYDYDVIRTSSTAEKQAIWNEISSYSGTNKKVWIKQTASTERRWFLCYSFDAPYLYFVAYTSNTRYILMFNQNGSITFDQKYLQFALSAGSGISMSNSVVSIKAGEGLGFSGDTLVVSGTSSNTKVVMLNDLTEQERVALYNELSSLYDYNANGWTSAYTEDMYAFYLDLRTSQQQDAAQTQDKYEGFFPMQCVRMHPSDYGGAAFFTGVQQNREGNGQLICIRYVITYDGQVDGPSTWWNNATENPEGTYVKFTSGGTLVEGDTYNFARACGNNAPNGYYALQHNGILIVDENSYDSILAYTNLDCSVLLSTADYPDLDFGYRIVFNFYLGGNFYRVIGDIVQGGSDEGWHLVSCTQI